MKEKKNMYIPKISSPSAKKFMEYAKERAEKNGISLKFTKYQTLLDGDGMSISGYFSDADKVIVCASGNSFSYWFSTFIHEFCHFEQWLSGKYPYWFELEQETLEKWLNGKNYKNDYILKCIRNIQACEYDCEKRTLKIIDKFDLPINKKKYIKKANFSLMFYNYVFLRRTWGKPGFALDYTKLLNKMPETLKKDYSSISADFVCLFDKENKIIIPPIK